SACAALDRAHHHPDRTQRMPWQSVFDLLTPVVKGWSTELCNEVASLGVQVHGGMGYIEETGAAQHYRDARIAAIYEGTNGIQAIDLVTRKLPLSDGAAVKGYVDEMREAVVAVSAVNDPAFGATAARLAEAIESLDRTTAWLLGKLETAPDAALAGATPYLRLFAYAAGGAMLANEALAAMRASGADPAPRVALARFFAENLAVQAGALERTVIDGADSIADAAVLARA
ncbi:MAG: acyl-CoA dehydrogenase, partial [Xanthobacteraceae bacterium]